MTKEEKSQYIEDLATDLSEAGVFYLTDTAGLDVETVNNLREKCFKSNVELRVVKNTLLKKAMEKLEDRDYEDLYGVLAGPTAIMFSEVGNAPAKLIKDFRKKHDKPILKGAYIEETIYTGEENLTFLTEIKSKNELIGEIVGLLQSPAKNVISSLQSGGSTLSGLIKALSERDESQAAEPQKEEPKAEEAPVEEPQADESAEAEAKEEEAQTDEPQTEEPQADESQKQEEE